MDHVSEPTPDATLSDEALITRLGDEEQALAELDRRYGARAWSLARAIVRNDADAEEVVLDVFLKVWRNAAEFDVTRGSVRAWITTMVRSRALDLVRARRRREGALERSAAGDQAGLAVPMFHPPDTESEVERSSVRARLTAWLEGLSPEQREALELAYFQGYTQSEIAERLDTPLGTVKTRIRTALMRLREVAVPTPAEGAQ